MPADATEPHATEPQTRPTMARTMARAETEHKVLCAAQELFDEHGYTDATIRDIACRAKVSVGTVMSVGDKEALLVQIFDQLIEAEHQHRTPITAEGCVERCLELVRPFLTLFVERLDLARVYASILLSGRHSSEVFQALGERLIQEFEDAITTEADCAHLGATAQRSATAQPHAIAKALHAAYIGTLFIWASTPNTPNTTDTPNTPNQNLNVEEHLRTHFTTIISTTHKDAPHS